MRIKQWIHETITGFATSFKRFPVAMAMAALTVAVLIVLNHTAYADRDQRELLERVAMVLAMGFPLHLIVHLFWESRSDRNSGIQAVSHAVGIGIQVAAFYFLVPDLNMVNGTRYTGVTLALYLLFLMVPCRQSFQGFERYVVKLFSAFFVTYLYSGILYGGLSAILGTIDALFDVNIPYQWYFDQFLIIAGVVAPAIFLAEIPRSREQMEAYPYSKLLRILLLYIVMPLLTVYTVILYTYMGRLLLIREWPQIMVSHLVVWYGIITVIVLFLTTPLQEEHKWAAFFGRWMPVVILGPFALLVTAMGIRIRAYGVTEPRYFVMVTAVWLIGSMIWLILRFRQKKHLPVVAALAAVALLSVTGPWSGYSISRWSQNERFETITKEAGLVDDAGQVTPNPETSEEVQRHISSIVRYFDQNHDLSQLKGLPDDFTMEEAETFFGFALPDYRWSRRDDREYFFIARTMEAETLLIEDYQYMTSFHTFPGMPDHEPNDNAMEVAMGQDGKVLTVVAEGREVYRKPLLEMVEPILEQQQLFQREQVPRNQLVFRDETDEVLIMVAFRSIHGTTNRSTGELELEGAELEVFFSLFE